MFILISWLVLCVVPRLDGVLFCLFFYILFQDVWLCYASLLLIHAYFVGKMRTPSDSTGKN